jgi:2-dehydro-3-deoxyphosphogluconate aldolase/(4S)-4-hydroxy-2-oxoglutarate aldolase
MPAPRSWCRPAWTGRSSRGHPAETSGGAAAIAALSAPFAGLRFLPTGGIGPRNAAEYLVLGAVAAVGGSWMVPRDVLARGDADALTALVAAAVDLVGATTVADRSR